MAEDEETATARYIASNISTQIMLKYVFEILGSMTDDADEFREDMKRQIRAVAMTVPLAAMPPSQEKKVREFIDNEIRIILTNDSLS